MSPCDIWEAEPAAFKISSESSFIPCLHRFFSDIPEPAPIGLSFLSLHQNPFVKPAMTPASDTSQPSFSLTDQQRVIQRTTPPSLTRHFHAHQMHLSLSCWFLIPRM